MTVHGTTLTLPNTMITVFIVSRGSYVLNWGQVITLPSKASVRVKKRENELSLVHSLLVKIFQMRKSQKALLYNMDWRTGLDWIGKTWVNKTWIKNHDLIKRGLIKYGFLSYRHECFTGKYTTRRIHKNYIRDPSGLFSIISNVSFINDVISVISLYYFIDVFLSI